MEATSEEITTLVGREVYSNNGVYVGEVEDIQLNLDDEVMTALAVANLNDELFENYSRERRGVLIPYRWVRAVGDVILINDVVERIGEAEEDEAIV